MEITVLPPGELAPPNADCVHIERGADSRFKLNCSALRASEDSGEAESVALIGGESYDSDEAAEAAGLAWAEGEGVRSLYVSRSA